MTRNDFRQDAHSITDSTHSAERVTEPDSHDPTEGRFLWYAIAVFALTRIVVMTAAVTAPQHRDRADSPTSWWSPVPTVRWDAGHYRQILMNGYPPEVTDTAAFFPAYSLIAKPVYWLLEPGWGSTFVAENAADIALVATSHLAALIGIIVFFQWSRKHTNRRTAFLATLLLCTYPPAMFFSTGYSEGVFFLCVALVFRLLDRDRVTAAAIVASVATATRPTGVCVAVVVVLWVLLRDRNLVGGAKFRRIIPIGLLSISGILCLELFLWWHYGRADAYFAAQANWVLPSVSNPWHKALSLTPVLKAALQPLKFALYGDFAKLLEPKVWNPFWNLAIVTVAVLGLFRSRRVPRIAFALPLLILLEAYLPDPVTGGRMIGIARYQLVALPCFLAVAASMSSKRRILVPFLACLAMLCMQCLYVRLFCDWILVG